MNIDKRISSNSGFTLMELIVTVTVFMVISSFALPELGAFQGQMQSSQDIRNLAQVLGELRTEAIRLKSNVRVNFSSTGFDWDIFDDSSSDGEIALNKHSTWSGGTPSDLVFNGLGLLRGVGTNGVTITVDNNGNQMSLHVNKNGYIEL